VSIELLKTSKKDENEPSPMMAPSALDPRTVGRMKSANPPSVTNSFPPREERKALEAVCPVIRVSFPTPPQVNLTPTMFEDPSAMVLMSFEERSIPPAAPG